MSDRSRCSVLIFSFIVLLALLTACTNSGPADGAPNTTPVLSAIEDQRTFRGDTIGIPFILTDEDPAGVTITASSDDPTLVADASLVVEGAGAERILQVTPTPLGIGPVRITLVARDAAGLEGSATFMLEVVLPFGTQFPKLTAGDAAAGDRFGHSVAMSGDYALIGAYLDDDGGSSSGSTYVFQRDGDTWTEMAKLTASDAAEFDFFGYSVAIGGDYALIGAYLDDDGGSSSGSAYVFQRDGDTWTEMAKLTASDAAADDSFGFSVAISGDYALVGATSDDGVSSDSGSAYVFQRDGDTWTEMAKLTASDAAADARFGFSVAVSGDYAVIGANRDDDKGLASGSAYVYRRSGDSWTEVAKLTASDAAEGDHFSESVAISGDYALIGAYLDDEGGNSSGSAYVFQRVGDTWTEMAKLTASDAAEGDEFGGSVAMAGDFALVSARRDDDDGTSTGSAYVFQRRDGTWSEVNKLTTGDAAAGDNFGQSVAMDGDHTIIGASESDDDGMSSGSVYVFLK